MRSFRGVLALLVASLLMVGAAGCGTTTNPARGSWGDSAAGQTQMTLTGEGLVTGTDGCNQLRGSWDEKGDTVTFHDLVGTLMACEGVDVWLVNPTTATVDGDTMHIFDAEGTELGQLERS